MANYTLVGIDGNAYVVMGYVRRAMRAEGKSAEEIDAYIADAESSDYGHMLRVSMAMLDELNEA